MNDSDLIVRPLVPAPAPMVPLDYAEKAMGSLMQLHSQLMEEKERRVDLYRRLMEKEQAVAELRMYVKLLEEKVAKPAAPPAEPRPPRAEARGEPPRPPPRPKLRLVRPQAVAARPPGEPRAAPPPRPPEVAAAVAAKRTAAARGFAAADGWKVW